MDISLPTIEPIESSEGDHFQFDKASDNLTEVLTSMELPNQFGIYGTWGSGKTSLMKMIQAKLEDNENIRTIWFNPWKYERKDVPVVFPLLHKLEKDLNVCFDLSETLKKGIPTGASAITANLLSLSPDQITKDIEAAEDALYSEYEKWTQQRFDFREKFENELAKLLEDMGQEKLFVFLDDLDRCKTENAIEILEEMKNYLNVDRTLFILGMDKRVIINHANSRYDTQKSYGEEYLEKMIPYSLDLPVRDVRDYISELIQGNQIDSIEEKVIDWYLKKFFKNNIRKVKTIVKKYLLLLSFVDLVDIKDKLLVISGNEYENQQIVRTSIFRVLLIRERFPDAVSDIDWVDRHARGNEPSNHLDKQKGYHERIKPITQGSPINNDINVDNKESINDIITGLEPDTIEYLNHVITRGAFK